MNEDLSKVALDRLMFVLVQMDVQQIPEIRARFSLILNDYQISAKEEALVIYTEGKNELFIKKFILAKAVAGCSKNTLRNYANEVKRALAEIGKDADTITAQDVQIHLAKIMQRSSKVYADNVRRDLSSFFGYLVREELIAKNPMNRVENIKLTKKKKPAFTEFDVELIRDACQNSREKAIVELLLSTGCRVSELTSIQVDDLTTGPQSGINILGKGDKYRNVYLNARAEVACRNYLKDRSDRNPYLFPRSGVSIGEKSKNGDMLRTLKADWYKEPRLVAETGPVDKGVIESIVRGIGKRAGVSECHPHRFRRTCATFALRRGMPIEQVSKMLGHANIATTQIYLDLSDEELAAAHKKYVV